MRAVLNAVNTAACVEPYPVPASRPPVTDGARLPEQTLLPPGPPVQCVSLALQRDQTAQCLQGGRAGGRGVRWRAGIEGGYVGLCRWYCGCGCSVLKDNARSAGERVSGRQVLSASNPPTTMIDTMPGALPTASSQLSGRSQRAGGYCWGAHVSPASTYPSIPPQPKGIQGELGHPAGHFSHVLSITNRP